MNRMARSPFALYSSHVRPPGSRDQVQDCGRESLGQPAGNSWVQAGHRPHPRDNTLYDRPGEPLRRRGALLRVRKYGPRWTVTYKDKSVVKPGRHKSRREIETPVENGESLAAIFQAVGFKPGFAYEKFRSEWSDGAGHVVIDETPIGDFGEIEGPPQWIDAVAGKLGIAKAQYITASYGELFLEWKKQTGNKVGQMLFPL